MTCGGPLTPAMSYTVVRGSPTQIWWSLGIPEQFDLWLTPTDLFITFDTRSTCLTFWSEVLRTKFGGNRVDWPLPFDVVTSKSWHQSFSLMRWSTRKCISELTNNQAVKSCFSSTESHRKEIIHFVSYCSCNPIIAHISGTRSPIRFSAKCSCVNGVHVYTIK